MQVCKCGCGEILTGNPKKKFFSPKCKKNYENSLRGMGKLEEKVKGALKIQGDIDWPGTLEVLTQDAFSELSDFKGKLDQINKLLNKNKNSLFSKDQYGQIVESVLSKMKLKYSEQFLKFYLEFLKVSRLKRPEPAPKEVNPEVKSKERFFG